MNFASDNVVGASDRVLQAIVAANAGAQKSYGVDDYSARVETRLSEIFEHEVSVFLVATGTAANALALACLTPPWGGVLTHAVSHVSVDECGAPEFFSAGAKVLPLEGVGAKPLAADLDHFFDKHHFRPIHQVAPAAVSVSQATECGLVYTPAEVAALGDAARSRGLRLHMDGARFANALVAQNASAAALTWRGGVDVLSFGATKNGCLSGEAVIFFDNAMAVDFAFRRKRSGHLVSKGRLLGAQLDAYLKDDHWLDLARHANAMAARLSAGLVAKGVRLGWETQANEVFPVLPLAMDSRLQAAGALYYPWARDALPAAFNIGPDEVLVRMVTSFATSAAEVDATLAAA